MLPLPFFEDETVAAPVQTRVSFPRWWPRLNALQLAALVVAALALLPLAAIALSILVPGGEGWRHLAATTLKGYVANSLGLMAITGLLSLTMGTAAAWLVTATRFPGQRLLSAALVLPLAAPGYIIAYVYTDLLAVSGPVQTAVRAVLSIEAARPVLPDIRSLFGAGL